MYSADELGKILRDAAANNVLTLKLGDLQVRFSRPEAPLVIPDDVWPELDDVKPEKDANVQFRPAPTPASAPTDEQREKINQAAAAWDEWASQPMPPSPFVPGD